MAMDCPIRTQETLLDLWAGSLSPELERHIAECRDCRAWVASQRSASEALDGWEAPPISPDFDRRLYCRIEAAQRPWWSPALRLRPVLSLAMASIVLLAAILMQSPPPRQVQVENIDADRLEAALEDMEMLRQFSL
jgi:hypothetical protein